MLFQTFCSRVVLKFYDSIPEKRCKRCKKCMYIYIYTFHHYPQFDKRSISFYRFPSVFHIVPRYYINLLTFVLSSRFRIIQLLCGTSTILEQQVGKRANLLVKWLVSMKLASSPTLYFIVDYIKWGNKRASTCYLGGWVATNLLLSTI